VSKRRVLLVVIGLGVLGFALDLWSKYAVYGWLYHQRQPSAEGPVQAWAKVPRWYDREEQFLPGGRCDVIPGWFGLIAEFRNAEVQPNPLAPLQAMSAPLLPHVNQGALFGMGGEYGESANTVYAAVSFAAALGIIIWTFLRGQTAGRTVAVALGFILGGTLGNCYDRVVFQGVRDFLYFYKINWPVFNVADCCLVCGAALLVLHAVFTPTPAKPTPSTPAATPQVAV